MNNKGRTSLYRWRGGLLLAASLVLANFSTAQPLMRAFQGALYVGYKRNFIILTTMGICIGVVVMIFGPRLPEGMFSRPNKSKAFIPLAIFCAGILFIGIGVSVIIRAILEAQGYHYL